jgi:DsbC/DsbD-like thiol-disulfide interchange protein
MNPVRPVAVAFVLVSAASLAFGARAETPAGVSTPWVPLQASRVRLVAGPSVNKASATFTAGLELVMEEGWKTYWRMPGDAGVPPSFDWAKSTNISSLEIHYPAPIRLQEPAAETVGYKGTVIFLFAIKPKDAGRPVELKLDIELGVCRDICIPVSTSLALPVPRDATTGHAVPALAAAFDRVPRATAHRRSTDPLLATVTSELDGSSPQLTVQARFPAGDKSGDIFIEAPDGIFVPLPRRLPNAADGSARFRVDLSRGGNASELKGKMLTLTLVSDAGASEATWRVP